MSRIAKDLIRRFVRSRGYELAKYPTVTFRTLPVFDMMVSLLMVRKGPELTFLQVGANDGVYGDWLSKFVTRYPWRGILIEPQPDVFERLKANYAGQADRLIFENIAVSREPGQLTMYRSPRGGSGDGYASSVASADPRLTALQLGVRQDQLEAFTVPSLPLDAVTAKHGWRSFDILMIDTEGKDCEVLTSLDLTATAPLLIQFEHGHLAPQEIDTAVGYLARNGYRVLYGGYQLDTIAARGALIDDFDAMLQPAAAAP